MPRPVTIDEIKRDQEVETYITKGNEVLGAMGYTEHSSRHVNLVSSISRNILSYLGFPARECELAAIAGYLHDLGNVVNRVHHPQAGALIAMRILDRLGMNYDEVATVVSAVGNHEEDDGSVVNNVGAALIIADKSDVHRTRVRNTDPATFDIHDRVNYAAEYSFVRVDPKKKTITLELKIDPKIAPLMEYFEIFLSRMIICRRAATFLGCNFELSINETRLL